MRFILTSFEIFPSFFPFLFFFSWFISPSFSVDDSYSLLQHRSHWEKTAKALGAFLEDTSVPLPPLLGLLVFFNLPPSASVSLLPPSHPTFGSPIPSPWNPNPSWSPILLQSPTASRPPAGFWPSIHLWLPFLSGLPSHHSASNPLSAPQPFLNSHSSFWLDIHFYSWTLLLHPFLNLPSF